jgi:putative DNA primase/helicase
VREGSKVPLIKKWQERASAEPDVVSRLFAVYNEANIAVVTGAPAGFFALDIDPRNGGGDSLSDLEERFGSLPHTVAQNTPGGGQHYLFKQSSKNPVRCGTLADYPGIDFKGTGGCIVLPPSRIGSRTYEWDIAAHPEETPIADPPDWLVQLLTVRSTPPAGSTTEIPKGRRNVTLTSHAGHLRRIGWEEGEMAAALLGMNRRRCSPPLREKEVRAIARSVSRYPPSPSRVPQATSSGCHEFHRSDLGNAERIRFHHGEDIRFYTPKKQWLVWDGKRWATDSANQIMQRAADTVRRIYAETQVFDDESDRKSHAAFALKSERADRLAAMVKLFASLEGIAVQPNELDQDPLLVNLDNGTLGLRSLELRPHRREDLITKVIPIPYDPNAKCPTWEKFLQDVFDENTDLIQYMQRLGGLCLSGVTTDRALFLQHGSGHNGKTTFVETLRDILGEYAGEIPAEELMKARNQGPGKPSPFLARLPGLRFVTASETEENQKLAAALVKSLTGGRDTITTRDLYGRAFSFRPQFKLLISTNHRPRITDPTASIWDRIHMIPFQVRIPDPAKGEEPDSKGRVKDRNLDAKLREEHPGILAWMVEGWRSYQEIGLRPPEQVLQATREYREQEDTAGQFISECLVFGESHEATTAEMKQALDRWAEKNNENLSWKGVTDRFRDESRVQKAKLEGARGWKGVGIRA